MSPTIFVSLHDKPAYDDVLEDFREEGVSFLGTEGTATYLNDRGIDCQSVVDVLDLEPRLDGQVKTLHPDLYQAVLGSGKDDGLGLDLAAVLVDLTPCGSEEALDREAIDIGGVSLLRAAAKNHPDRVPLVSADMAREFLEQRPLSSEQRRSFARRALRETVSYDLNWHHLMDDKPSSHPDLPLEEEWDLRYGENPHQEASVQRAWGDSADSPFEVLGDKDLSYTNCLDLAAARSFLNRKDPVEAVVIKHTNPTGWASGEDPPEVVKQAWAGDPKSAFGGVVAVNRPLSVEILNVLEDVFLARVFVPSVESNLRERLKWDGAPDVVCWRGDWGRLAPDNLCSWENRYLLQQPLDSGDPANWTVATETSPSEAQQRALEQAWRVVAGVSSNAAVVARPDQVLGVGAGQQSRVDAVRLACEKAHEHHGDLPEDTVLASDGFFPFPDNVEVATDHGVRAFVQPGGSVKDEEVLAAARDRGASMVFTDRRVFRH